MRPDSPLFAELRTAERLAREAGRAILPFYGRVEPEAGTAASPVTAADRASNALITAGLREAFPADAILSEEERDSPERLGARRVWIVDPLDGTKEFLAQNGEFAVMLGLVADGEPVLGVVYLPESDVLYGAVRGEAAWVESGGERAPLRCDATAASPVRMVASRSHPDPLLAQLQEALGTTDVRPSGSVGVKCALIAEAQRDLYVHPVPYLKEWDTCAPEVILREAGGIVTDCLGEPLRYNKPEPVQPHGILASAPGCAAETLRRIRPIYARSRTI